MLIQPGYLGGHFLQRVVLSVGQLSPSNAFRVTARYKPAVLFGKSLRSRWLLTRVLLRCWRIIRRPQWGRKHFFDGQWRL